MAGDAYETAIVAKLVIVEARLKALELAVYGHNQAASETQLGGVVTGVSLA